MSNRNQMMNFSNKNFFLYYYSLFGDFFFSFKKFNCIILNKLSLINMAEFLHSDFLLQYKILMDIFCVDFPKYINRFHIYYCFLSYKTHDRLFLKVCVDMNKSLNTLTFLYKSANWLEREIWDMFGVFFKNHNDLRRILTDYGFEGFPLRKDFPLSGYLEVRYDDSKKVIIYEPVELAQELRFFHFKSPWL